MRNLIVVLLALLVAFPASAILIDAVDDAASLALADSLHFMGCGAGWDEVGGTRYRVGSCSLIRNNDQDGAWVITAAHAPFHETTGATYRYLRYTFLSYYEAFLKGTISFVPGKSITASPANVFYHPMLDIALVKLDELVRDASGTIITPVEFYTGELFRDQVILMGGYGDTGLPSQGGEGINDTRIFDGYRRCARGVIDFFFGSLGLLAFFRTVPLPGIGATGDSGGFAAVEINSQVLLAGILVKVYDRGEHTQTGFEYISNDPSFFTWMNGKITENSEIPTPTKTNTISPTLTATMTDTPLPTATVTIAPTPTATPTTLEVQSTVENWGNYE
ncbi:MAG: hypothetical protein IT292_02995 [Deltaproteobacteria bacterium]|nr:hypothetical protein [Deltaproteobacteria bacterium]